VLSGQGLLGLKWGWTGSVPPPKVLAKMRGEKLWPSGLVTRRGSSEKELFASSILPLLSNAHPGPSRRQMTQALARCLCLLGSRGSSLNSPTHSANAFLSACDAISPVGSPSLLLRCWPKYHLLQDALPDYHS
jgi:hypothetical protein